MLARSKENPAVLAINLDEFDLDALLKWYQKLDKNIYHYHKELQQIQKDDTVFAQRVIAFVKE